MATDDRTSASPAELRHTPLYEEHKQAGARLVPFAGWEMPVQYEGLLAEHHAVRQRAGLFDVSHMGEARVTGGGALDFLQHVTCNNVAKLTPGRAHYTGLMNERGGFVDDLLIYRRAADDFLLVLNAANTAKDVACLQGHAGDFDVSVEDVSAAWAQLALQGPSAPAILESVVGRSLEDVAYYHFVEAELCGARHIVSRTGYTGEDGFEIYGPAEAAAEVWRTVLAAGREAGCQPAGLGARDTLRLEAKMALYGQDIGDDTTPYEADLGWIVKLKKGEFIGRDVLARQKAEGVSRKLVGFEMEGRAIARHGYPAFIDGVAIGEVTSGSLAPTLQRRIGLVYVPTDHVEVGTRLEIEIRGRREPATIVPTPFYKRER